MKDQLEEFATVQFDDVQINATSQAEELRINCGGAAHIDEDGKQWIADKHVTESAGFEKPSGVANLKKVYQSYRYGPRVVYDIPTTSGGDYEVSLHFADLVNGQSDERVFIATINGVTAFENIDIAAESGGGKDKPLSKSILVENVGNGGIRIQLDSVVGRAVLSGIEVLESPPNSPRAVTGGPYQGVVRDNTGKERIVVDGTGSYTNREGDALTSYEWIFVKNGNTIGTKAKPTFLLPVGAHDIILRVRDSTSHDEESTTVTIKELGFPAIDSFEPSQIDGDSTTLTIQGTGFTYTEAQTIVHMGTFDLTGPTQIRVVDDTTITVLAVPLVRSTIGDVWLSVETPKGETPGVLLPVDPTEATQTPAPIPAPTPGPTPAPVEPELVPTATGPTEPLAPGTIRICSDDGGPQDGYSICLDLEVDPQDEGLFTRAAEQWSSKIVGDLPDVVPDPRFFPASECSNGYPSMIDDLYICGKYTDIDGPGNVVGSAGPRTLRSSGDGRLPSSGHMEFDIADIERMRDAGTLEDVMTHEMAHVLGIGTLWSMLGVTTPSSENCQYLGENAIREWKAMSGCSNPIPTEQDGGGGTRCGHWDEVCLGSEVMTGFIGPGKPEFSKLTMGAIEDLGYEVANYNVADDFSLESMPGSCCNQRRLRGGDDDGIRSLGRRRRRLTDEGEQVARRYGKKMIQKSKMKNGNDCFASKFISVMYMEDNEIFLVEVWDES